MAEMLVSPLVSLLIGNLAPLSLSFIPSGRIDRKLKQWTNMLVTIQAVLEDAEDRQLTEKPIQLWLHDVQKLAFEIDDLVDDLATEAQRRQMMAIHESSRSGRLRKFTSKFSPTAIRFNYDMDRKIGDISNGLQELEIRKNFLGLKWCVGGNSVRTGDQRLSLTSSVVDPTRVVGREDDIAALLTWLLEEDRTNNHDGKVRIISIVGMGGIGKTTLAQSLYNDGRVQGCFHDRAWVCVTEDFDVLKISKIIYEEVYEQSCAFNELNKVQEKLIEKLSKKKFLLVLDDVWNQDYAKWALLCAPFHGGSSGSTIIVTTRNQDVARTMGSKKVHVLEELSDGDCLSLLAQHAFGRPNFDGRPEFIKVGKVIARRCKGLPLAYKSLGGLLRTKGNPKQWEEVSTSKIWELQTNDIMPALRLSYHHLPPYLKPLFAYCSIFPKAYEFDHLELIMLWMAQGLLRKSEGHKQMEELGYEYFSELLSRSFFQRSTMNKSRFVMHDLNNDLAQFVAGLICVKLDREMESNKKYNVSEEARHASFISHKYDDFKKIKAFAAARCLRTILPIREKTFRNSYLSNLAFKEFPRLPCLRALSFMGYHINELPKSIGKLNHLRYLDLSRTNIIELPKFICEFSNLQTLLLNGCSELIHLPTSIHKLINLRHLSIFDTPRLKEMPLGIGLLIHLRTLTKFIVEKSKGGNLLELRSLHHLCGILSISGMENVLSVQDAKEANILGKEGLSVLVIKWSSSYGGSRDSALEFKVLDALRPHIGLYGLGIEFYGGLKLPGWVGDRLFCDMVKLRLVGCKNCESLPPLGQLTSLRELFIQGMAGVKIVDPEFFGTDSRYVVGFQSLIKLSFVDMGSWEDWCACSTNGAFPCLQLLEMWGCTKLNKVSLPKIPSIESLDIYCCSETVLRSMVGVCSVKRLRVSKMSGLIKLDEGIIGGLGDVEDLYVSDCEKLRYLWDEEVVCRVLEKLKFLRVHRCVQLESLGDEEQLLPLNLEIFELWGCDKLEKMPNFQNNLKSLRRLNIQNCKKLQDNLTSLAYLEPKTENQGQGSGRRHKGYEFSKLEIIDIRRCTSLKWFPTGKKLPTTLRSLVVKDCENMKEADEGLSLSLLESVFLINCSKLNSIPQGLAHLTRLEIIFCQGIKSISETSLPPTLITLMISDCSNLKYMLCANEMQSLTSLRRLTICTCKNLEGYPSAGLWPPNLEDLRMGEVKQPISEWGLATLPTSLLGLELMGEFPQLVSFSEVGPLLPTSLPHLRFSYLKNLESLGEGLENLSSLQHLSIMFCTRVRKLPQTLLPTLSCLQILECPLLKERCQKGKRDYWPKISHIPFVEIDRQLIWEI